MSWWSKDRLRLASVLFAALVFALYIVLSYPLLNSVVSENNASVVLSDLTNASGVLIGFTAIVLGALMGREKVGLEESRWWVLIMCSSLVFLLLAMISSLFSQATLTSSGLRGNYFVGDTFGLVMGAFMLVFGLVIREIGKMQ